MGLSQETPPTLVSQALAQRAPAIAAELAGVEASLATAPTSEQEVLTIARRLHALAYPVAAASIGKGERS